MQIDLLNYLKAEHVLLNVRGKNKKAILTCLVDHLIAQGKIDKKTRKDILKVLTQREDMGSTAIGGGIALPHARVGSVKDILVCVGITQEGIDFGALDDEPVYILVLLLSNQKEAGLHLKMLALLARLLRDKLFVQKMRHVSGGEELIGLIKKQQTII